MNNKTLLTLLALILVAGIGVTVFMLNDEPDINIQDSPISSSKSNDVDLLKDNWQVAQAQISFRPSYHNQVENTKGVWRTPGTVQLIGAGTFLIRFEDDNQVHTAVFKVIDNKLTLLELFKNRGDFSLSEWQDLVKKFGDASYCMQTYTVDFIRNKQITSFPDLTKVSENVFIKEYWQQNPDSSASSYFPSRSCQSDQ